MKYRLTPATLFALAAALCALLAAWFMPLPRILAGEEELVVKRLPQTRANVMSAQQEFKQAQERYQKYIKMNDIGAWREYVKQAIAGSQTNPLAFSSLEAFAQRVKWIEGYATELQKYGEA